MSSPAFPSLDDIYCTSAEALDWVKRHKPLILAGLALGPITAQCTITDKKSIVIFSCSMTLLDYWRSFFLKLTIVNHLWEIETNAKVAYTEH